MKRFLRYIFVVTAMLMVVVGDVWGQTYNGGTWYSLYDTGENSNVNSLSPDFAEKSVFAPAESMTFEYKKFSLLSTNGKVEVYNKVNGTDWSSSKGSVSYSDRKNWNTSPTISLDANISHIRYKMASGTGVYVRNHFVKLKKHILLYDGGYGKASEDVTFDDIIVGQVSGEKIVNLRSFLTDKNGITITSSNPSVFRVMDQNNTSTYTFNVGANACAASGGSGDAGGSNLGDISKYSVKIYFCPTEAKMYNETITISDGTSTATINVSGKGLNKYTATFNWLLQDSYYVGDEKSLLDEVYSLIDKDGNNIKNQFHSSIQFSSSDPNVVAIENGQLVAKNAGEAKITAYFPGTNEWFGFTAEIDLTIKKRPTSFNLIALSSCYTGEEFALSSLFSAATNNPEVALEYISGDESILKVEDGKLIAVCAGTTTFTVRQQENYKWLGHSQILTITVNKYNSNFNLLQTQYTRKIGEVITEAQLYTHSNTEIPPTVVSDNPAVVSFNVSTRQLEAKTAGQAIITISQPEDCKWTHYNVTCTVTVQKHTPVFTWKDPVYFNQALIEDYFATSNKDTKISIINQTDREVADLYFSASNPSDLHTLDLTTYNKETSTKVTVAQEENWYWYAKSEEHTITPIDPNNHVKFTITNANQTIFGKTFSSNAQWSGSGYLLGDGGWFEQEDYVIIQFTGVPDQLYFDKTLSKSLGQLPGTYLCRVYESVNGMDWGEHIWESNVREEHTNDNVVQLSPTTRFLKFSYYGTVNCTYKNITVTELDQFAAIDAEENEVTAIDFGDEVHVDASQTRYFDFKYANAGYKVKFEVISNTPDNTAKAKKYITFSHKDFVTIDGEKYLTSIGGEQLGTINDIAVQLYSETDEYSIPANTKIKISDEIGHEYYITLSGEIVKADQILMWQGLFLKDPVMLPLTTGTFSNVAKSSNDDLPITYESSNLKVITISNDGKTLTPIAEGEVVITAKQEGNHIYNPATPITRSVVVTGKKVQVIIWESSLSDLQVGDEPVTLTAKAYWIDMENDAQLVYSEEQTSKIQFTSNDPSIVSIEGNVLTIHAAGSTTVKAFVPGNETYKEDQQVIPVRVRPATTWCDDELLIDHSDEYEFYVFDLARPELVSDVYEIDHTKGVPGTLEFQHTGKPWTLGIEYYGGSILAQQSVDGNNWTEVTTVTPTKNATNISEGSVLDRRAKYIRFVRPQGGVGYHYVSNVKVYPANYIETSIQEKDFGTIQFGSQNEFSFEVAYSNIKYQISPKANESDVIITPISFGSCGAFGTQTITGTWTPNEGGDNITRTITFTDINTGKSATVTLKANVLKKDQFIKWEDAPTEIDDYTDIDSRPRKTLNASDEEVRDITYEIVNGTNLAAFDNGMFYLKGTGDIRIRAYHNGDAEYKPVEQFYNIHIASIQPTFLGTKNQDWTIHENWVNGIQPNGSDDFVVILAPTSISGMQINVKGLQIADNGAITVTSTGGMTVGEKGVSSAKNESRISINNTPEGAGFFRIHPVAVTNGDTPATVTVNYTTKAKSGDPRDEIWQYVGAPGNNMQMSNDGILVYHWKEQKGWLLADTKMQPFVGYALTRTTEGSNNYEIHAEPVYTDQVIQLTKTASGMNGDNLFANSYLAPIDVRKIDKDDIIDPDNKLTRTFFLFNSGSWNDWKQGAGDITAAGYDHSSAGHYYSIPFYSAKLIDDGTSQVVIPPMQGVYVYSEGEATIKFNYAKHVYGADASDLNKPMRMPQEKTWSDSFRRVRIQATSKNSGADRMYIVQEENTTSKYDNGYDGDNILAAKQVNIYTNEPFGQMEVSCSNNIDSMFIGFTAGEDSEYTLTFGAVVGKDMYLKDIEKNESILITDGGQYIFYAQPNSVNDMRFQLLLDPHLSNDNLDDDGVTTGGDNICSDITRVWINDKKLYVADVPKNTKLAVYTASGVCIATPYIIHHTPYTLDLSYLPTGVYVLRLNNQAYKFVCE